MLNLAPVLESNGHCYWIVPARAQDAMTLASRLREMDLAEVAGTGNNPKRSLWRGYRNSLLCEAAFVDGEVAAMWGVGIGFPPNRVSLLSDMGRPWLLTSPLVELVPMAFAREARRIARRMLAIKPRLENYVLASYAQAIRLLRLIGFTVDEPTVKGTCDNLYCRFHTERGTQ